MIALRCLRLSLPIIPSRDFSRGSMKNAAAEYVKKGFSLRIGFGTNCGCM